MSIELFPGSDAVSPRLDNIYVRIRCGQKGYYTKLANWDATARKMLNDLTSAFNSIVWSEMSKAVANIINHFYPLIPVDTGALRAAFVTNFHITVKLSTSNRVVISMEFNLDKWLTEIPYARYHIEELVGKSQYKFVSDKRPLDLDFFSNQMTLVGHRILKRLVAAGWDVEYGNMDSFLQDVEADIVKKVDKWLSE